MAARVEVRVDDCRYFLDTMPGTNTQLVKDKLRLFGVIDLEALFDDFGRLGNCVGIVYHGVNGIDELQFDIQQICYDVIKLCNKSAVAVKNFKNVSIAALSSLKATYEFLMDSFEELALVTLAHVKDEVMQMGNTAEELQKEFDNQAEKLIIALEKTLNFENAAKKAAEYEITHTFKGSLKSLSIVMTNISLFWCQLHAHCRSLGEERINEMIQIALKCNEERRLKIYNSTGFKSDTIQYFARWVTLDHVCGMYMERIKLTQRELYTYIQEAALHPADVRKKFKELVTKFQEKLLK